MEHQNTDLVKAASDIDLQLQEYALSRTTRLELLARKRIIERMLE